MRVPREKYPEPEISRFSPTQAVLWCLTEHFPWSRTCLCLAGTCTTSKHSSPFLGLGRHLDQATAATAELNQPQVLLSLLSLPSRGNSGFIRKGCACASLWPWWFSACLFFYCTQSSTGIVGDWGFMCVCSVVKELRNQTTQVQKWVSATCLSPKRGAFNLWAMDRLSPELLRSEAM